MDLLRLGPVSLLIQESSHKINVALTVFEFRWLLDRNKHWGKLWGKNGWESAFPPSSARNQSRQQRALGLGGRSLDTE